MFRSKRRGCHRLWGLGEEGFTLPEVLITIVLLGIIFAIATSSWFNLVESRRVASAANQLAADLRLAHTSAENRFARWRLVYKDDGTAFPCGAVPEADYCLIKLSSGTTPTVIQSIPRQLPEGTSIRGTNLRFIDLSTLLPGGANRAVEFSPDGSAEALGGFNVTVTELEPTIRVASDDGNPQHRVHFVEATSRIKID